MVDGTAVTLSKPWSGREDLVYTEPDRRMDKYSECLVHRTSEENAGR